MSETSGIIQNIIKAANYFDHLYHTKYNRNLVEGRIFRAQAKHGGTPGVIAIERVDVQWSNQLGIPDVYRYFIIFRRTSFPGWAAHCGISKTHRDYYTEGITVALPIYRVMHELDSNLSSLVLVRASEDVLLFDYEAIRKYTMSTNTIAEHQLYPGQIELGLPFRISRVWEE